MPIKILRPRSTTTAPLYAPTSDSPTPERSRQEAPLHPHRCLTGREPLPPPARAATARGGEGGGWRWHLESRSGGSDPGGFLRVWANSSGRMLRKNRENFTSRPLTLLMHATRLNQLVASGTSVPAVAFNQRIYFYLRN
jgi:hypothetical protein